MRHWLVISLILASPWPLIADEIEHELKRFIDVFSLVEKNSAEPIDPTAAMYRGALPAMLHTLDPHSVFLDPDQFESLQEMQRSTEKGFGSVVSLAPGRVIVLQTLPESPSARAGLSPGDEVVVINGYNVAQLNIEQLVSLLGEARRQSAELMVRRTDIPRLIPLTLTPAELADPSVQRAFFLEPGVAYVKLANFEANTAVELREAVDKLGHASIKGMVLDLRNNPGGVIESAVAVASYFLEPKQRILWIEGRDGPQEEVRVPDHSEPYRFPVTVLIDNRTASAAELVAGALKDNGRATIIGDRSFGKALVQSVFPLSEGAGVALTTARYLTPDGKVIQRSLGKCGEFQLAPCNDGDDRQTGGIEPDQLVYPRGYTEFEQYMEGTNSFLDFAKAWVRKHSGIDETFEPGSAMLDDFQIYLSERRIRPTLAEWSVTLPYIRSRLKQEVLNLAVSVEAGDLVEAVRDPQVRAAIQKLAG